MLCKACVREKRRLDGQRESERQREGEREREKQMLVMLSLLVYQWVQNVPSLLASQQDPVTEAVINYTCPSFDSSGDYLQLWM